MNQQYVQESKPIALSVLGVNYKKADLETRGLFGFSDPQKKELLQRLYAVGISAFILSTCNRSELYYDSIEHEVCGSIYCEVAGLKLDDYRDNMNFLTGREAKLHLLKVASGLDSQILGDFEIVGQIKRDYNFAKELGVTNANLERWANTALQMSKRVKNETSISTGASSVAFASIEYLRKQGHSLAERNILVVGMGKIGINTCKNIIKHGSKDRITLTNRTDERARDLARKLEVRYLPYSMLQSELLKTDVLIIATGASSPIITREHLQGTGSMTIFDLSVPRNVCQSVDSLDNTEVLDVDRLSKTIEENNIQRRAQIPLAESIIEEGLTELDQWLSSRKRIQLITSIKRSLNNIGDKEIQALGKSNSDFNKVQVEEFSERLINKIVNQFACHLTSENCSEQDELAIKEIFQINE